MSAEDRPSSLPQGGEARAAAAQLRREQRQEQVALLPEVWGDLYGPGRGYLSLFSGLRRTPTEKLTLPHQAHVAYPAALATALRWIEQEAA